MAQITTTGAVRTTLEQYVILLENAFRSVFGQDLDVDPETPQGQLIGIIALSLAQSDEAIIDVSNAANIYRAVDQQIDGLAAILSILRDPAERSQVTVTLTGVPATLIPAGSRARTDAGDLFSLSVDTQLSGAGTATATMLSVETGAIAAAAGTLDNIVDIVPGWETVNNVADATSGRSIETDTEYRARYFRELSRNATAPLESVIAAVSEIEGVSDVVGRENDLSINQTIDGVVLIPHSIAIVVQGGGDTEIAQAMQLRKTGGTATNGTTTVTIPHPSGFDVNYNFFRPTLIGFELDLDISTDQNFPGNGISLIKERIQDYINGAFDSVSADFFDVTGIQIGEDLSRNRLFTPINSVIGHTVNSIVLSRKGVTEDVMEVPANLDQRIVLESLDDVTITVT